MNEQDAIIELLQILSDMTAEINRIAIALERSNEEKENNSEAG